MTPDLQQRADQLEELAMRNAAMPDGLSTAEQLLFLKFRLLYQTAALGSITPEQGRLEKLAILDRYRLDCFDEKCWQHTRQLWKIIEAAGSAYALDRTVENADRFQKAVYGMKPKGVN